MGRAWGIVGFAVVVAACSFDPTVSTPDTSPGVDPDASAATADATTPAGECGPEVDVVDIVVGQSHIGTTVDGSQSMSELCMQSDPTDGPEHVHRVILSQPGNYRATTKLPGTTYDAIVYARTACTDAATTLPCDDNTGPNEDSVLISTTTSEQMYYIIVDTHSAGTPGNYELRVDSE